MSHARAMVAILPCIDLDASEGFYRRLGFANRRGPEDYRMLSDDQGREIHLTEAVGMPTMLTNWPNEWANLCWANPRTNRGARMSLRCRTRMRHWFELAGQQSFGHRRQIR
jgi:hypothetical protein